jgi:hypothetical protein
MRTRPLSSSSGSSSGGGSGAGQRGTASLAPAAQLLPHCSRRGGDCCHLGGATCHRLTLRCGALCSWGRQGRGC